MGYNDIAGLVGRRVDRLYVREDAITFECDNGLNTYELEADCCSHTWMADVFDFDQVAGKVIERVEDDLPEGYDVEDGRCKQEFDSAYGIVLIAGDGSRTRLVYRNSSNGYYGGWISKVETGTVDGMELVEKNWRSKSTEVQP